MKRLYEREEVIARFGGIAALAAAEAAGHIERVGLRYSAQSIDNYFAGRRQRLGRAVNSIITSVVNGASYLDQSILNAAAGTLSSEQSLSDGGALVGGPETNELWTIAQNAGGILQRCTRRIATSNTWTAAIDEEAPWAADAKLRARWTREAEESRQSKLALGARSLKLHKLDVLVPITDELLEDAPALGEHIIQKGGAAIAWALEFDIFQGNGTMCLLGALDSSALKVIAPEGAQTGDTINGANASKMYAALPATSLANGTACAVVHPDGLAQLPSMGAQYFTGADAGAPAGRLLGLPLVPHEACEAVGDLGDIMFADFSQYLVVAKTNAPTQQISTHLWFEPRYQRDQADVPRQRYATLGETARLACWRRRALSLRCAGRPVMSATAETAIERARTQNLRAGTVLNLRIEDFCAVYGVSESTAWRLIRSGRRRSPEDWSTHTDHRGICKRLARSLPARETKGRSIVKLILGRFIGAPMPQNIRSLINRTVEIDVAKRPRFDAAKREIAARRAKLNPPRH